MPTELKLPELGENIAAGDVVRVLVKPGDTIAKDQPVIELETDKATIEVPSSIAGVVKDVQVKAGQKVKVGQTILTVDGEGEAAAKPAEAKTDAKQVAAAPADAKKEEAPKKAEAAESDEDEADEPAAAEARPDQVAEKPEAPNRKGAPRLPEDEVEESPRKRGEVVDISRGPRSAPQPAAPDNSASPALAAPAAPSVRRIARELGVDIRQVNGSGPGGRINVDDVQAFVRQALAGGGGSAPASVSAGPQPALPDFSKFGEVERKPLSNIRRKTAEHLGHAWNVIPHVTNHDKTDITALEELRKKYGPQAERAGGKLTVTVVALKILAAAIRKFPQFGASIDLKGGQLVYKKYVNMGVAVDTDRGLLVPVLRDVDKKGIVELSAELAKLSEKARAGKLSLDEMSGGVMTITNLGGIGGVGFTPIVNWPEVAILGISRGSMEPVWNGREFQPRLMLPLSLSYDHRVIDGADAARFLRFVAEAFEQPFVLAL
jgi:pyruvate dehydrogenase E2 component (dihydrolipoamide acetyltransferase)